MQTYGTAFARPKSIIRPLAQHKTPLTQGVSLPDYPQISLNERPFSRLDNPFRNQPTTLTPEANGDVFFSTPPTICVAVADTQSFAAMSYPAST